MPNRILWIAALLPLCLACDKKTNADAEASGAAVERATTEHVPIVIRADRTDMLFSFMGQDGKFQTVDKVDAVPEEARGQVTVTDTSLSPEKRQSDKIIYVADLREPQPDGTYSYAVVSRYGFEPKAREMATQARNVAAANGDAVVVYSTVWCGACKSAKRYLTGKGVDFIEKDIEKDPGAQQELMQKAQAQGVRVQGVPVLDVYGELMMGFDKARLERMLSKRKN